MDILTFTGAWASILGGVIGLFYLAENVTENTVKKKVAQWLKNDKGSPLADSWPKHFTNIFDSIFGKKYFRPRCLAASLIASVFGAFCVGFVLIAVYPDAWTEVSENLNESSQGLMFGLITIILMLNAIPDYISLLESRYLLGLVTKKPTVLITILILLADILCTIAIWVSLALVVGSFFDWVFYGSVSWLDSIEELWDSMKEMWSIDNDLSLVLKVTFFSTFFTSFWLWAYLVSSMTIKLLLFAQKGKSVIFSFLNIEKKPLLSIGFVTSLLITFLFLASALLVVDLSPK